MAADLSTEDGARRFAEEVGAAHPRVDVLVNNAGATWGAPLAEHDTASWDRVLNLNVQGIFHTTKFFLPLLEAGASAERARPGSSTSARSTASTCRSSSPTRTRHPKRPCTS